MLEVRGVRAGYGAINVLWDVDLNFGAGKLTTIIGPNGAGKTTLLRAIMGQLPVTQGAITLDGRRLDGTPTWRMPDLRIAMIPEGRMTFRDMSVEENLLLGAYSVRRQAGIGRRLDDAYATFPRLAERRRQLAGSLSGGEAQMLAMARGLMAEPQLLLIDEPSLGLAPVIVQEIFALIARLKAQGRTIVLVEQNTERAVAIADAVYLLQGGKVVLAQPAAEVDLHRLHRLYFAR
ncbi:MAG: ABC transporter ATP-binding protein [Betaproteobacteria bacterium]